MKQEFRAILPRRWIAERTIIWFGQSRRLVNDSGQMEGQDGLNDMGEQPAEDRQ